MQRIDREKIVKWAQSNKNLDAKEGLEAENKELLERNEMCLSAMGTGKKCCQRSGTNQRIAKTDRTTEKY